MILPLAAFLIGIGPSHLSVWQHSDRSVFLRLFPHATGQNGLEDYVRAGDLLNEASFQVYQNWQPLSKRPSAQQKRQEEEARKKLLASMTPEERRGAEVYSDHLSPEDQELADHLNSLTFLQVKQEEIQRYGRSVELLLQGNRKPFVYSIAESAATDNEDLVVEGLARRLTRLASDAAFVSFSAGQGARGAEMLGQALVMAHRLGSGDVSCRIASSGLTSTVLGRFNEQLGAIPLAEAKAIGVLTTTLLDERATFTTMIQNEKVRMSHKLDQGLQAGLLEKSASGRKPAFVQEYENLSPPQREAWLQSLHRIVDNEFDALGQRFDSPEDNWLAAKEMPPSSPADPQNLDQFAAAFSKVFTFGIDHELMFSVAKSRTQIRLLRLHAKIIGFRWETGHLPGSLDDLKLGHDELHDPLSRKPFVYAVTGTEYKLTSQGTPETGPIDLRYRPQTGQSSHDADRP